MSVKNILSDIKKGIDDSPHTHTKHALKEKIWEMLKRNIRLITVFDM